jgi:ribose-phosphate pyrophosphokinase
MTTPLVFALPSNDRTASEFAKLVGGQIGKLLVRRFPDGETYLRYETTPKAYAVVLLCTLDRPDDKFLPLLFAAAAARDLGAKSVGLVVPYLAYMRQDRRFNEGEAITSSYFARVLSAGIDWLVTIDPHLHRRTSLNEIYSVPTRVVHAAPLISAWIRQNVEKPLLIGPDSESEQWVAAVARDAYASHLVLNKIRHGDRDVEVSVPDVANWRDHTPVLIDDIVSTGRTMIEAIGHLKRARMRPPVCIAVHGIFADNAYDSLLQAGASRVVTTTSVPHVSNTIDITTLLAQACADIMNS